MTMLHPSITHRTSTLAGFMGQRAWIGHANEAKTFDGPVPREAAIELLSYPIGEGRPTYMVDGGPEIGPMLIEDSERKAIIRLDTQQVFGVFSKGYKPHLPAEWLVSNLELILDGGLEIGTVAVTRGGARAILQAEMPENRIATAPGAEPVAHRPQVNAITSFDGTVATTYGTGTRVIICENQLSVAGIHGHIAGFDGVTKIRHTSQSLTRVLEVRESLGIVVEQIGDAFDEEFAALVAEYVSESTFNEVVADFTGWKNAKEGRSLTMATAKRDALVNLWHNDERVAPWKNSAYGVLAAFNTAQHHVFGADKNRTERNQEMVISGKRDQFDGNVLRLLAHA